MGCWHGHYGPCWDPYHYPYWREEELRRPRPRPREEEEDLRDYLHRLEDEPAVVRRKLEELTARRRPAEAAGAPAAARDTA